MCLNIMYHCVNFRDRKFSYLIYFFFRIDAWTEWWKLRHKKMGSSWREVEWLELEDSGSRRGKREHWGFHLVLLWGCIWKERVRTVQMRGRPVKWETKMYQCGRNADGVRTYGGSQDRWTLLTEGIEGRIGLSEWVSGCREDAVSVRSRWKQRGANVHQAVATFCYPLTASQERLKIILRCADSF